MDFDLKTRQLLKTSAHGRIGVRNFQSFFPQIDKQLRSDAGSSWLGAWGQSRNFDEFERARIVDPKLLSVIGRIANHPIRRGNTYHSGLIHTYGYLLSLLKTRYGFKRERWTSGVLEKGLGLSKDTFAPCPPEGTLLENVTFLMTKIAFPRAEHRTLFGSAAKSHPLAAVDLTKLSTTRIEETFLLAGSGKTVTVLTDLIDFRRSVSGNSTLLIYSAKHAKQRNLFTCFPIPKAAKSELLDLARNNTSPIVARYNAVLPSQGKGIAGTRSIKQLELKN